MKRILFFLLAVVAFSSCNQKGSDEGFVIEKGVNIAHWLSQSGARGEFRAKYFTEADVAQIVLSVSPATIVANAAVGPEIFTRLPPKKEMTKPATMAV